MQPLDNLCVYCFGREKELLMREHTGFESEQERIVRAVPLS